jgi:type II secretory pathway pseudopilin PulG
MSRRQSRQWRVTSGGWRVVAQRSEIGGQRSEVGFSLVEVTVAIGIFAFVVVGVLGLLPTALRMRAESAQETRAVLIAQELFSSVFASGGVRSVVMRDGPGLTAAQNVDPRADLLAGPMMIGYPTQTTVPFYMWHSSRGQNPDQIWETGALPPDAVRNGIETLARLRAEPVPNSPDLFKVICEVRSGASLPLSRTRPTTFTAYVYSPPVPPSS